jgi:hypothetical protein
VTTTYYASITGDVRTFKDVDHASTSSTAADIIEIRMGNGTYVPTRMEVLWAMEVFERWLVQGGLDQLGANMSPVNG